MWSIDYGKHVRVRRKFDGNDGTGFVGSIFGSYRTPMSVDYPAANSETETGASAFGREERVEDACTNRLLYSWPSVCYEDDYPTVPLRLSPCYPDVYVATRPHRFDCIQEQIQK